MGTSGAPRPRSAASVADARPRRAPPVLGWWELRAATIAGWALGGFVLTYTAGAIAVARDGDFFSFLTALMVPAVVVGVIVGAIDLCRSKLAAILGLAGGILLSASLPNPAGLGLLAGPLGIATPLLTAVVGVAALGFGLWRGSDGPPADAPDPEDRAFAPPGERRRILRRWRRRR